jgi:hypothetical protein
LLNLLIDQTPTTSICVLLTCRPEFQPSWSHRSYLTEMTLNRLSHTQIEQIAMQVAGGKTLPAEIIQQLVDKTDGVPLYVEEMTKTVLESGVLKEMDERYELTGAVGSMTAAMAGTTPPPTGTAWTLTNVLCFAAVIGFTITAWAVYRQYVVGHGRAGVRRRRAGRRRPVRRRAGGQLDVGSGNLGRADQPVDGSPGQRGGDRARACTCCRRLGHTAPMTGRADSRGFDRSP